MGILRETIRVVGTYVVALAAATGGALLVEKAVEATKKWKTKESC